MSELKGVKFLTTDIAFYLSSRPETIINESDMNNVFELTYSTVISNIQKLFRNSSDWIIDSVIDHNINIKKCKPLCGSSHIKLPKEVDHPKKGLINIQNNAYFKWCLVKYLHLADHYPAKDIILKT